MGKLKVYIWIPVVSIFASVCIASLFEILFKSKLCFVYFVFLFIFFFFISIYYKIIIGKYSIFIFYFLIFSLFMICLVHLKRQDYIETLFGLVFIGLFLIRKNNIINDLRKIS